jgi:hypothetical protein
MSKATYLAYYGTGHETAEFSVMGTPLLVIPKVVTITSPLVAPAGMGTMILVDVQLVGVPGTPLKVTVPDGPKLKPLRVIGVPTSLFVINRLVMTG